MVQRVALVTGAARGIGLAVTLSLLKAGRKVMMVDMHPVDLASIIPNEYSSLVRFAAADVTNTSAMCDVLATAQRELGPVTILVNNAGISPKINGRSAGVLEVTDEEWAMVWNVNVTSILKLCQLCVPAMKEAGFGRIVNLSSQAGRTRSAVAGASYMASKSAVLGLSRALANEMGQFGITSNCVAPGRILTEMAMQAGTEVNDQIALTLPVRRLGTTGEVADAVTYLSSDTAGFVNGAVIDVNGGSYMS